MKKPTSFGYITIKLMSDVLDFDYHIVIYHDFAWAYHGLIFYLTERLFLHYLRKTQPAKCHFLSNAI